MNVQDQFPAYDFNSQANMPSVSLTWTNECLQSSVVAGLHNVHLIRVYQKYYYLPAHTMDRGKTGPGIFLPWQEHFSSLSEAEPLWSS